MKLTVYRGNTVDAATRDCLKAISSGGVFFQKKYVIAPDRFSLSIEEELLELYPKNAIFNTEVVSFTRLALKLVDSKLPGLTKEGTILVFSKVIFLNLEKLTYYKKVATKLNFAKDMFAVIASIRSSGYSPDDLEKYISGLSGNTLNKFLDILIMYRGYEEEITNNYLDTTTRLDELIKVIISSPALANTDFFVVGFNNFTAKEREILLALIRYSHAVYIGLPYKKIGSNADIYPNLMAERFIKEATDMSCPITVIDSYYNIPKPFDIINDTLFSYNTSTCTENKERVKLINVSSPHEEAVFLAQSIAALVDNKGYRYQDIAIINALESFQELLTTTFDSANIPYFVDRNYKIIDTMLCKYLISVLKIVSLGISYPLVSSVINNPIFGISAQILDKYLNYLREFNIKYNLIKEPYTLLNKNYDANDLSSFEEIRQKLLVLISFFEGTCNNISDFISSVRAFLTETDVISVVTSLLETLDIPSNFLKANLQAISLLDAVLTEIVTLTPNLELSKTDYISMLLSALETNEVALVPTSIDTVYIGDIRNSRFKHCKVFFVCSASSDAFPHPYDYQSIITERDFSALSLVSFELYPSPIDRIAEEEFVILDLFSKPTDSLIISYPSYSISGEKKLPSIIYKELLNLGFDEQVLTIPRDSITYKEKLYNIENVYKAFRKLENGNLITSVSQIESYMSCPYKHFAAYELKLLIAPDGRLKVYDIGSIIHNILERYFHKFDLDIHKSEVEIAELSQTVITEEFLQPYLKNMIKDNYMVYLLELLREEAKRVLKALSENLRNSSFFPKYLELKFGYGEDLDAIYLQTEGNTYNVRGKIDRVDAYLDKIIVIDYKTGSKSNLDKLNDIKIGKKIQLYFYLSPLIEKGYQPSGVFYLPINDGFSKDGVSYAMIGQIIDDWETLTDLDHRLKSLSDGERISSKTIAFNAFAKKDGSMSITPKAHLFERNQFDNAIKYVKTLAETALNEVEKGNIAKLPLEGSCEYCIYQHVCGGTDTLRDTSPTET